MLARHYGLDCDPVYERQWRLSDHGNHAVADYLSKISDLSVVVAECSAVIPETAEAMEGLLRSVLPDGDSQISRLYVFGPSGLLDYGSATLRSKI